MNAAGKPPRARKVKELGLDPAISCRFAPLSTLAQIYIFRPIGVENDPPPPQDLFRTALRPFRWHPLLRSRRRAAEIAGRCAALAVRIAPRAPGLARLGA